jgi:hypothetical protein
MTRMTHNDYRVGSRPSGRLEGQRCSSAGAKSQFVVKIAQTAFFD